ncbi:MGMT family protein [Shewanella sp. NIFS-20-20]|uniref:MGMT family protein n=1 Tax=Shewanella sp. NIFS-20-20 TaxID=2853806 RepID=UPI001C470C1D|nr:MGMT family protein [Shewanella sp. NIFS-20-20]
MFSDPKQLSKAERICRVVELIPCGQVSTYGRIADYAGLPRRARFVSQALRQAGNANIPWHRVVNSQGKIALAVGSTEYFNQIERLRAEAVVINTGRVNLKQFLWQPDAATLIFSLPF